MEEGLDQSHQEDNEGKEENLENHHIQTLFCRISCIICVVLFLVCVPHANLQTKKFTPENNIPVT